MVPPPLDNPQRAAAERHRIPVHQPGTGRGRPELDPNRLGVGQELDVDDVEPRRVGAFHPLVAAQHLPADAALRQGAQLIRERQFLDLVT